MRWATFSQWSDFRTGVMWWCLGVYTCTCKWATFPESKLNIYVYVLVLLSNITSVMSQDSITDPGISVALIGDKVEMNCVETSVFWNTWAYTYTSWTDTSWTYTSWDTSTERELYQGGDILDSLRSRYKIDKRVSGQHNLIIESVDTAHAGRYRCTSDIERILWTDMQLIVLGNYRFTVLIDLTMCCLR